jgi:predicted Rossmann-fold nucleotide-binding protein
MPGGFGTLDETVEIATWRQLGLHDKPVLLCNAGGWADALLVALRSTVAQGFAGEESLRLIETVPDVAALLTRLDGLAPSGGGDAARL